jgi:hypothetical protein
LQKNSCVAASMNILDAERNSKTPRQWAILAGRFGDVLSAEALHGAGNIRDTDPFLVADYRGRRVSEFGGVYRDTRRGYQADGHGLFEAMRSAQANGHEVLGSIHMHADLQNVDRPDEISPFMTELATPIDHDLFRASGWPLNLILYVERSLGDLRWSFSAWIPGLAPEADYRRARVIMLCA